MTTINIHKDKLLPAAFAYQQRKLASIDPLDTLEARCIKQEYLNIYRECIFSENGIVSLDIDVVQRIFGEE